MLILDVFIFLNGFYLQHSMTNFLLQLFFFLLGSFCFSQVEVQLKDDETGSTIYGAAISSANGSKRLSDPDGIVKINENELPNWFLCKGTSAKLSFAQTDVG